MSNREQDPQVEVGSAGRAAATPDAAAPSPAEAGGLREDLPAPRFTQGLSSGVSEHEGEGCVVELLEPAHRARHRDDMRAALPRLERCLVADAARGPGNEDDLVGEGFGHAQGLEQSDAGF